MRGISDDEPSSLKIVTGFCQSTMMTLIERKKAHTQREENGTVGTDGGEREGTRRKGRERDLGEKGGD